MRLLQSMLSATLTQTHPKYVDYMSKPDTIRVIRGVLEETMRAVLLAGGTEEGKDSGVKWGLLVRPGQSRRVLSTRSIWSVSQDHLTLSCIYLQVASNDWCTGIPQNCFITSPLLDPPPSGPRWRASSPRRRRRGASPPQRGRGRRGRGRAARGVAAPSWEE